MTSPTDRISLARVGRARGLKGEVVLRGDDVALDLIEAGVELWVGDTEVTVASVGRAKEGPAVRFEGVTSRNGAEAIRGETVSVEADRLPAPTPEWFLFEQVEGFSVVDAEGVEIGSVVDCIRTPGQLVLTARPASGPDVLIPGSPGVVREIDAEARRIVIEVIPGLLDLNS